MNVRVVRLRFDYHGVIVYWDERAAPPTDSWDLGTEEAPCRDSDRRRFQAAAEEYVAEIVAARAEHLEAVKMVDLRGEERFRTRSLAAVEKYRPYAEEIAAIVQARAQARHRAFEHRRDRTCAAFDAWNHHHDGNRTLAEKACWRSTADGIDVGGTSDAYTLATAIPEPAGFTDAARAEIGTATSDDARTWWTWAHGTARNLRARADAVARVYADLIRTLDTLNADPAHRNLIGWAFRLDRAALTPSPLPQPPPDAMGDWFAAHVFVYGASGDHVLDREGRIQESRADTSSVYTRGQLRTTWVDADRFVDDTLNARLMLDDRHGVGIHVEHRVSHLLGPDAYLPFIGAAADSMIGSFRRLIR